MAKKSKGSGFSLKDQLFNRNRIQYLARLFQDVDARFETNGFVRDCMRSLKQLELKERIVHIAMQLEQYLPDDFGLAAKRIISALPPRLDPTKSDNDFGDFIIAPLGEFVVRNGQVKKHLKLSLRTLKELTMRFSMEDSIRAFLNSFPKETMAELIKWSRDKNYHVRRLASEGTRPLLPWSKRLNVDIETPMPILDELFADPTRYVTRSVANHLNDIAKTRPALVVESLKKWKESGRQEPTEMRWMSKHALRTLVKQGHKQTLKFLGFRPNPKIEVIGFAMLTAKVSPGQAFEFEFQINALRKESLLVDYVVDFVKANGKHSPKVHKLKQIELKNGQKIELRKRHVLHANATTYTLYPGKHRVTLQINGKPFGTQTFLLVK